MESEDWLAESTSVPLTALSAPVSPAADHSAATFLATKVVSTPPPPSSATETCQLPESRTPESSSEASKLSAVWLTALATLVRT